MRIFRSTLLLSRQVLARTTMVVLAALALSTIFQLFVTIESSTVLPARLVTVILLGSLSAGLALTTWVTWANAAALSGKQPRQILRFVFLGAVLFAVCLIYFYLIFVPLATTFFDPYRGQQVGLTFGQALHGKPIGLIIGGTIVALVVFLLASIAGLSAVILLAFSILLFPISSATFYDRNGAIRLALGQAVMLLGARGLSFIGPFLLFALAIYLCAQLLAIPPTLATQCLAKNVHVSAPLSETYESIASFLLIVLFGATAPMFARSCLIQSAASRLQNHAWRQRLATVFFVMCSVQLVGGLSFAGFSILNELRDGSYVQNATLSAQSASRGDIRILEGEAASQSTPAQVCTAQDLAMLTFRGYDLVPGNGVMPFRIYHAARSQLRKMRTNLEVVRDWATLAPSAAEVQTWLAELRNASTHDFPQTDDVLVVTLRGTQDATGTWLPADVFAEFDVPGLYETAVSRFLSVVPGVDDGKLDLVLAGHSLGGMVAERVLSDADFTRHFRRIFLVTFGSPAVGHPGDAVAIQRFSLAADPVAALDRDDSYALVGAYAMQATTVVDTHLSYARDPYVLVDERGNLIVDPTEDHGIPLLEHEFDAAGFADPWGRSPCLELSSQGTIFIGL